MARLIDADALLEIYKKWIPQLASPEDDGDRRGVETCITVLKGAPTVDAVEVVRCKDCKYRMRNSATDGDISFYLGGFYCGKRFGNIEIAPDDFCSRGERED